jgi:hypothetical protein
MMRAVGRWLSTTHVLAGQAAHSRSWRARMASQLAGIILLERDWREESLQEVLMDEASALYELALLHTRYWRGVIEPACR